MNNTVKLVKSEVMQFKGRNKTPSFFCADNLPEENKIQLNEILAEIIIKKDTKEKGENKNENT